MRWDASPCSPRDWRVVRRRCCPRVWPIFRGRASRALGPSGYHPPFYGRRLFVGVLALGCPWVSRCARKARGVCRAAIVLRAVPPAFFGARFARIGPSGYPPPCYAAAHVLFVVRATIGARNASGSQRARVKRASFITGNITRAQHETTGVVGSALRFTLATNNRTKGITNDCPSARNSTNGGNHLHTTQQTRRGSQRRARSACVTELNGSSSPRQHKREPGIALPTFCAIPSSAAGIWQVSSVE